MMPDCPVLVFWTPSLLGARGMKSHVAISGWENATSSKSRNATV